MDLADLADDRTAVELIQFRVDVHVDRLLKEGECQRFGFRVSGFGLQVSGFGFRVSSFGFRISDFGFWF